MFEAETSRIIKKHTNPSRVKSWLKSNIRPEGGGF